MKMCNKKPLPNILDSTLMCDVDPFTYEFWREKVIDKLEGNTRQVIVKGCVYYIGDEMSSFKGFDGSVFRIKFKDGRKIITHNLWSVGYIPDVFLPYLQDNAEFVSHKEAQNDDTYRTL